MATVRMPRRLAVMPMRRRISPRLAMNSFLILVLPLKRPSLIKSPHPRSGIFVKKGGQPCLSGGRCTRSGDGFGGMLALSQAVVDDAFVQDFKPRLGFQAALQEIA